MHQENSPTDDAVILALIFYSDSTQLSGNGNVSGWPIVMSLANIPLDKRRKKGGFKLCGILPQLSGKVEAEEKCKVFKYCMEKVLSPLKELSHAGIMYKGKMCYPLLYAYVHDYPEGCKVN